MSNLAVFISGNGSNLQAIINRWKKEDTAFDIKLVFCNKDDAYGIRRATKAGIPVKILLHSDFVDRQAYDQKIQEIMLAHQIDLIALAGFMRLLSSWFVEKWAGKILNIHPSLLPAFPGLNAQKQALEHGVRFSGCSVFFVDSGVDTGAIISQAVVPIFLNDSLETLSKRILKKEHLIFPTAINDVALGKVSLCNSKAVFKIKATQTN
ncbi:MAG: phosphoribosylglycinamide formyltransferase [Deltaproteobacteria bacterium]|nr:phosphoribosylglycinamide formyltransferase [Deltaproteobacteria bacterium]